MRNSKFKNFFLVSLAAFVLPLSSCIPFPTINNNKIEPTGPVNKYDGYYQPTEYSLDVRTIHRNNGKAFPKTTGNQKILVVPVRLKNAPAWTPTMLNRLEKSFFGTTNETNWESVSSYYQKSSYNKLNISGTVDAIFESKISTAVALEDEDISYTIAKEYFESADPTLLKVFDIDKNGLVDSICFIYSNPIGKTAKERDVFWAWVGWNEATISASKPGINNHMWASYHFIDEGYGTSGIDAHTFIHETGHLLGLDDYYPYDNNYAATGKLDMMDNNILDHNIYSKMLMGWTYPYVIDGTKDEVTINLKPFESSGEAIIINDNWNGSPLDEYIAIEFYTPTGLNEKDAEASYADRPRGFTIPGVKIYHVDSRVAKLKYANDEIVVDNYISTKPNYNGNNHYDIAAANSNAWSYVDDKANIKLLHLIEATGTNSFRFGGTATNNTLFKAGDVFRPTGSFFKYATFFNNFKPIGYQVVIDSVASSNATITIKKNL